METKEEEAKPLHAILYVDGSAIPNPGAYGYGVHGYFHTMEEGVKFQPKGLLTSNKGYLDRDTFKARVSFQDDNDPVIRVQPIQYIDLYGSCGERGTNNQAEIYAMAHAITTLIDRDIKTATIFSDSSYVLLILDNIKKSSAWKTRMDLDNRDLWMLLDAAMTGIKDAGILVKFKKIEAHKGLLGNETADRLAFLGSSLSKQIGLPRDHSLILDAKDYWPKIVEKHPMVNGKQIFFVTNNDDKTKDGKQSYFSMNYKEEIQIGKPSNVSRFSLSLLNKPIDNFELIKERFNESNPDTGIFSTIRIDVLQSYINYKDFIHYKNDSLVLDKRNRLTIMGKDKMVVCNSINPPGRAKTAMETRYELNAIIEQFKDIGCDGETFTDITERYLDDNGKIINTPLKIKYENTKTGKTVPINLQYNFDILPKNDLNRLLKTSKVYLVVKKDSKFIRYFTLVHDEKEDEYVVSCNYYANVVLAV